ncbi:peptidase [Nucisporomicrobium flavum]|uniref:peptidase n=1 Tax=Nucisporomicrobium flavum TaxID=2785915 RepID=UPI0018F71C10|nr:peptidase [Nucisporomicrobium flavum]
MTSLSHPRRWTVAAAMLTLTVTALQAPASATPAVGATTGTAETAGAAGPAGSAPGAASASVAATVDALSVLPAADRARMERQRPLVAAASVVRWEVERRGYSGYAGITLEDSAVALWWKGVVPPSMRRAVANASRTAPVLVRSAAHSLGELRAAAAAVRAGNPGLPIQAVKLKGDGSGLVVSAPPGAAGVRAAAGVPVSVVHEPALRPTSRDDDWSPWKGGATIVNTTRSTACTSGFGVRNGSAGYLLTAAHCGQGGDRFQDARGEFIGNVGPRNQDHDVELVPTSAVDGYVYIGNPDDNLVGLVEGWGWTFVGEYLCQSGVSSSRELGRPVCNLKVLFFYADREDLVEAEQTEGQPAARPGDSGGPVYSISGSGKIVAKGTVTRTAGARLGFQDYGTAWRDFGITPATR